ncbi:MAG: monovalent cation/H(+) antiporter subunit G [Pseudomonadota bacterium]
MIGAVLMAAETAAVETARAGLDWVVVLENVLDVFTVAGLLGGLFFVLAGSIGVIRLPDFYTRLHAAGVTDTLGAELILFALILQSDSWQVIAKLLMVAFFLFISTPTATHAVAHAAWKAGEKPRLGRWKAPALEDEG